MSERAEFCLRYQRGERMTDLCREYGVSRTTGYKFIKRFQHRGVVALADKSRAPRRTRRTAEPIRQKVLELRRKQPTWGPLKLRAVLEREQPGIKWPAASTIGELLVREGLVRRRKKRSPQQSAFQSGLSEPHSPNDVWAMDFKGEFRLGNTRYCYPFTVSDLASRYVHICEAFERIHTDDVRTALEELFEQCGIPFAIRSDNGSPFASSKSLFGLTRLSAWLLTLGIALERIVPGQPQQNGCHERMHRTLKADSCRPAAHNVLSQQERFDRWRHTFNHRRPHEALALRTPADIYQPSRRSYAPTPLSYPLHDEVKRVSACGHVRLLRSRNRGAAFLSSALAGQQVGVRELDSGLLLLTFVNLDLGHFDPISRSFERADLSPKPKPTTKNL